MRSLSILLLLFIACSMRAQIKIPARIECETPSSYRGGLLVNDTTSPGSGGTFVWMKDYNWMSYYLNIAFAGKYIFKFRVAAEAAGAQTQIRKSDGSLIGTFTTPATGGSRIWQTVSDTVDFAAGKQTIRIINASGQNNIDWFEIDASPPAAPQFVTRQYFDSVINVISKKKIFFDGRIFTGMKDNDNSILIGDSTNAITIPALIPPITNNAEQ